MSHIKKRLFSLGILLCMLICSASATAKEAQEVFILNGAVMRGASWPTSFYDLSRSDYKGEISTISTGNGVYASKYFKCNSDGELHISATMTCRYPAATISKICFEIYLYDTKELVASYRPSYYESYNQTTIEHTFNGLATNKNYVIRFLNASKVVGWDNPLSGPIRISHS